MSYWTDWYIADETDAAVDAAVIAGNDPCDLSKLTLDSIIQTDLDELADYSTPNISCQWMSSLTIKW